MSTARIDIDEPIQGARPMVGSRVAMTGRVTQTRGEGTDEQVMIEVERMAFEPPSGGGEMVGEIRAEQARRRGPPMGGGGLPEGAGGGPAF